MIVLGLNGKLDGHDPAAVLLRDGRLVAAVEEERLTHRRHEPGGMPHQAAAWVLAVAGVRLDEVDAVAYGWDPARQPDPPEPPDDRSLLGLLLPSDLIPRRRAPVLRRVPHHLAHAAGAWVTSGFEEAAVLVVDGSGEQESISAWHAGLGGLAPLWSRPLAASLGFFYLAITLHLGMRLFDEGKTMGLAGWGEPIWDLPSPLDHPAASPASPTAKHYREIMSGWRRVIRQVTGLPRAPRRPDTSPASARTSARADCFTPEYRNLAASGQHRLERDLLRLATEALQASGAPNLAIAGGVGLNCLANGRIEQAIRPAGFHVQPACHDAGVALGAAAWVATEHGVPLAIGDDHVYSGPAWSPAEVAAQLAEWGLRPEPVADPVATAVELLAGGALVARFAGPAEYGPRALGARSILADPSRPGTLARVNRLKLREPWRPLGPALTVGTAAAVFERPVSGPFMLVAHPVPEYSRAALEAVVHVDGTTRPQVVGGEVARGFGALLDRFTTGTGVPALVNTSFNVAGPIVASPDQAVATFMSSGLDALLIEDSLLVKPAGGAG